MNTRKVKVRDNLTSLQSPINRGRFSSEFMEPHAKRVKEELKKAGALPYDMLLPETYYLPTVIHPDEHVMGSVFGRYHYDGVTGRGALVATDKRVIFLDKKPLYVHYDELTFMVIGSVTYTRTALVGYVTLHTRLDNLSSAGSIQLRTFNHKNAYNFVQYIEEKCLHHRYGGQFEHTT